MVALPPEIWTLIFLFLCGKWGLETRIFRILRRVCWQWLEIVDGFPLHLRRRGEVARALRRFQVRTWKCWGLGKYLPSMVGLEKVRVLDLRDCQLPGKKVPSLSQLSNLEKLWLPPHGVIFTYPPSVTALQTLMPNSTCRKVRKMSCLPGPWLREFTNLTSLTLQEFNPQKCERSHRSLKPFQPPSYYWLTSLQGLRKLKVFDTSPEHLPSLPFLEKIIYQLALKEQYVFVSGQGTVLVAGQKEGALVNL